MVLCPRGVDFSLADEALRGHESATVHSVSPCPPVLRAEKGWGPVALTLLHSELPAVLQLVSVASASSGGASAKVICDRFLTVSSDPALL